MDDGLRLLTEKERETLRLLVNGYDAKSMARQCGLSVHTINERLRDARRKLGVSSSREAARMLHAAERPTANLLGDKFFGADPAAACADDIVFHQTAARPNQRVSLILGGLIMSLVLALASYVALSGSAQTEAQSAPVVAARSGAATAANRFMVLLDARDWAASYAATAAAIQSSNSAAAWATVQDRVRTPLGKVRNRQLIVEDYVPTPVGYQLIKFRTDYAKRAGVIETLSLAREGGEWKVVGIVID